MSAKSVMNRVMLNDSTMANDILPTKRNQGRRQPASIGAGAGANKRNQPLTDEQILQTMTCVSASRKVKTDLLSYDNKCGIHGAARERKGIKRGTSAARRRYEKELINVEIEMMELELGIE